MNKYEHLAKESRQQRAIERACLNKRRYETAEDAACKGQNVYHCPHCGKYHRTSGVGKLVAKLNRLKERADSRRQRKRGRQRRET